MSDDGENGATPRKRKSSDGSAEDWVTWKPDSDRFCEEIVGEGVKLVMKYLKPAMEDNRSRNQDQEFQAGLGRRAVGGSDETGVPFDAWEGEQGRSDSSDSASDGALHGNLQCVKGENRGAV